MAEQQQTSTNKHNKNKPSFKRLIKTQNGSLELLKILHLTSYKKTYIAEKGLKLLKLSVDLFLAPLTF